MPPPYQAGFPVPQLGIANPFAAPVSEELMLLRQLSQASAPVVTMPSLTMRTGFESLPGFNQPGIMGLLMNQHVAPRLQQLMSKQGLVPGGLASQNLMDYQAAQQYTQDQASLMRDMSAQDQESYYRTIQGAQAITGNPFNAPQRAAARRLAATASGLTPTFAVAAPELVDAMAGRTGSASVMAMRMQQFNRFKVDPVTGLTGYSRESNSAQATQLFDTMFKDDNMASMRGLRAGQVGNMYGEMMRRGMVGGDTRTFRSRIQDAASSSLRGGTPEQAQEIRSALGVGDDAAIDFSTLDTGQLDKLRKLEGVQGNLRKFNATAVKDSLSGYVDAVTTMREIFGDAGMSNAPMSQLIQGLEALSQGTLTQIDPSSLNMMVRTTQQLAKQSGMTIDSAIMMQQQGATTLQGMGVSRAFAPQVTQGAMAFGQAAGQAGVGSNPAWGLENLDFHRQMDQNLRASAAASPTFNALSALLRVADEGEGFAENSRAAALASAVKEGRTEYTYGGEINSVYDDTSMIQDAIIEQGRDIGLSPEAAAKRASSIMRQTTTNSEYGHKYKTAALVRSTQSDEVRTSLFEPTIRGSLPNELSAEDRAGATEALSKLFTTWDADTRTDKDKRSSAMLEVLKPFYPEGTSDEVIRDKGNVIFGELSSNLENTPYRNYGSMQNLMVALNEGTNDNAGMLLRRSLLDGQVRDSVTGLTGNGVLSSLITAVQGAGEGEGSTLTDILAKTVGGVSSARVADRLQGPMDAFIESREKVEKLQTQFGIATDNGEKSRILDALDVEQRNLRERSDALRTNAEKYGLVDKVGTLDHGDIDAVEAANETVRQNRLTSGAMFLRPQTPRSDADRIEAGTINNLLNPEIREDELLDLLNSRGDKKDKDGKPGSDRHADLIAGKATLSDADKIKILDYRQDQLRIAPSEAEVTAALAKSKVADNRKNRLMYSGMLATQTRMRKTGVTFEQLQAAAGEEGAFDKSAIPDNMSPADEKSLWASQLEDRVYNSSTLKALRNAEDVVAAQAARREAMTPEQRKAAGDAHQDRFDLVQGVIEDTAGAGFIGSTGGAGIALRAKLIRTQEVDAKLKRVFGGSSDATALLAGPNNIDHRKRLAAYADAEMSKHPDMFFDEADNLLPRYTSDGKTVSRDSLGDDAGDNLAIKARMAIVRAKEETDENNKTRKDIVNKLRGGIGAESMRFTLDEDTAKHLLGSDATPEAIKAAVAASDSLSGLSEEQFSAVREAASEAKIEGIEVPGGQGAPIRTSTRTWSAQSLINEANELGINTENWAKEGGVLNPHLMRKRIKDARVAAGTQGPVKVGDHTITGQRAEMLREHQEWGIDRRAELPREFEITDGVISEITERDAAVPDLTFPTDANAAAVQIPYRPSPLAERVEAYRQLQGHVEAAGDRAAAADLGDPSKALSAIGAAAGLSEAHIEELRSDPVLGRKFATGEGQAWAREIARATASVEGSTEKPGVYTAIKKVMDADTDDKSAARAELKNLVPDGNVKDLMSAGGMLRQSGMLDILVERENGEVEDAAVLDKLRETLSTLENSGLTVAQATPTQVEITGELAITNNTGTLIATSGLATGALT